MGGHRCGTTRQRSAADLGGYVRVQYRKTHRSTTRQRSPAADLGGYVRVLDAVLEVRHEHEVARLEPPVVQRVVVDVQQNGARADPVRVVLCVDELAQAVHDRVTRRLTLRRLQKNTHDFK